MTDFNKPGEFNKFLAGVLKELLPEVQVNINEDLADKNLKALKASAVQIQDLKNDVTAKDAYIKQLEGTVTNLRNSYNALDKAYNNNVSITENKLHQYERGSVSQNGTLAALRRTVEERDQAIACQGDCLQELGAAHNQLQAQLKDVHQQINARDIELGRQDAIIAELEAENQLLKHYREPEEDLTVVEPSEVKELYQEALQADDDGYTDEQVNAMNTARVLEDIQDLKKMIIEMKYGNKTYNQDPLDIWSKLVAVQNKRSQLKEAVMAGPEAADLLALIIARKSAGEQQ